MNRESIARLLEVREEFARLYQKPLGRFVSLGFSLEDGRPCLNVLVDDRFETKGLPEYFKGIQVHVRESPAGVLAVGSVEESAPVRR